MTSLTVVLGGAGKTGGRIAERLTGRGAPVRLASRSTQPSFDWSVPDTWAPALDGAGAVYLAFQPDLAFPGAAEAIGGVARQAVASGARRLVLLSGRGEEETWPAEQAVRAAGADWTILRCSWFAQNFSESFLLDGVLDGVVALPGAAGVGEPFLDAEDIADVAVAALTDDRHAGRVYELTGPGLVTFAQAADLIAAASGRSVRYQPLTETEYIAGAVSAGLPAAEAQAMAALFAKVLDGRNAHVTEDVPEILGRPARAFDDYVKAAAAGGAWD
jgi:uncharacterized protein YbjT (DUF2867 family)